MRNETMKEQKKPVICDANDFSFIRYKTRWMVSSCNRFIVVFIWFDLQFYNQFAANISTDINLSMNRKNKLYRAHRANAVNGATESDVIK